MQHGLFGSIQWSGSGTFKVTFNVHGHSRLRSMFTDIHGYVQGSRTFKVHSRFGEIQGYVQGSGTLEVTFMKWYWSDTGVRGSIQGVILARDTGRERIDSESDIGKRHGA